MQLPKILFPPECRPFITVRHLIQATPRLNSEPFLYRQEQALGFALASVSENSVQLSFLADFRCETTEVHVTFVRGTIKPNSLCCPKCGKEARRLYFGPFQCALCRRIDQRVMESVIRTVASIGEQAPWHPTPLVTSDEFEADDANVQILKAIGSAPAKVIKH